ncbi:KGGVGR-motif variant AAA ATPase [Longimicrobium sp.]|uniref:KGGVGR-motif variant AAA ATPase n=1 Tax=Longimicrobium sp. TaxID=2029185 RepID=UPI003B3A1695
MNRDGRIITFYSYKGGTGRSMALANVAWILASSGKRVLAIDWDLEAPGLHRYFAPFLIDPELFSSEGLIDYVWAVSTSAMTPGSDTGESGEATLGELADFEEHVVHVDWPFPGEGSLDLVPAGRQCPTYAERVNAFSWDNFYERLGGGPVLNALRDELKREYDFVLIDSRTGVSDTSGICTVQMPDALVVLFTLNKQGIRGAAAIAASVREHRDDLPIFPVPTRIDMSEHEKLTAGLRQAREAFRPFTDHASGPTPLDDYWGSVEFPYVPYFSFEEVLAPFADERGRKTTLLAAATRLTSFISGTEIPEPPRIDEETRQAVVRAYAHEGGDTIQTSKVPEPPAPLPSPAPTRSAAGGERHERSGRGKVLAAVAAVLVLALVAWASLMSRPARGGVQSLTDEQKVAVLNSPDLPDSLRVRYLVELYRANQRDFAGIDLSGLDLSNQRLTGIQLRSANLRDTRWANTVLDSADLSGANLTGALLPNATLIGARLDGAQVAGADLSGANLYGATVTSVSLDSARTSPLTVWIDSVAGPVTGDEDVTTQAVAAAVAGSTTGERVGYIWIGNYDRQSSNWQPTRIARGQTPLFTDPGLITPGQRYQVRGNMTLRQSLPANDSTYFTVVVRLGMGPRGTTVEVLERPRAFSRPTGRTQYWMRVRADSVTP